MVRFEPNVRRARDLVRGKTLPPPLDVGAGHGIGETEKLTGVVASKLLERALLLVSLRDNRGDITAASAVTVGSGHGRHLGEPGGLEEAA